MTIALADRDTMTVDPTAYGVAVAGYSRDADISTLGISTKAPSLEPSL